MARWTCPRCDRQFGRARQSHTCLPGGSVAATFTRYPPEYLAIYGEIRAHLAALGRIHEDAVQVGVFLKRTRKLAEIRPKARSLELNLYLPHRIDDGRIARHVPVAADRIVHVVKVTSVEQIDDCVRSWLTEAFDAAG